jgi:hypothetical protein
VEVMSMDKENEWRKVTIIKGFLIEENEDYIRALDDNGNTINIIKKREKSELFNGNILFRIKI